MNRNQKLKRKHFWTMQPCRPGRNINCQISQANAYLAQLRITSAVYQLRSAKRSISSTIWHSRISPAARYSCVSTAIKTLSESPAGRRSRRGQYINRDQQSKGIHGATVYHQRGISTAFSKAKAYLPQLYITSAVYQPRSAKRKHIWRSRISTAITILSKSTAGRHGRADQRCISTAISKAKAYPAQLYINTTVYQPRSAKGNNIWHSCISTARNINRYQHSGSIYIWRSYISTPRYTNRDQQREIVSGTTAYQQRGTSTAISTAQAYISGAAIYQQPSKD